MPDSLVPLMVSSGLGFGVIAGVVSGICYVVIQGFRSSTGAPNEAKYGVNNPWQCCICGTHFNKISTKTSDETNCSIEETDNQDNLKVTNNCKYSVCENCNGHACRTTCGQWVRDPGQWLCKQCVLYDLQTKTRIAVVRGNEDKSWFKSILTALQPNAVTVRMSKPKIKAKSEGVKLQPFNEEPSTSTCTNSNNSSNSDNSNNEGDEREIVRDFIERLVGAMLGANLDDTPVSRLYADSEYDAIFDRYHCDISTALTELGSALHISIANLPVTGQTPCTAHASLKNIIRRVLRDASNMAILKDPQNETESPETTTNRTYEDLLATAILNKVIDNYQTDLRRSSSGSTSSKRSDVSKKHKNRKYEEERWRTSINNPDLDNTSVSSVEEWCRSDSSCGSKYVDHMSFTIQQSIEEITTSDDEHPNNHYLHKHALSKNSFRKEDKENDLYREDWQDNWLFSRKGKGSPKPVPVPMLVPNPSTEFRALIGDRDAEDTTDLSETGSDVEETDSINQQDIKNILIDSRTVIGGKNILENISVEYAPETIKNKNEINIEEASKDSGVDEDLVSEARNNILIHETPYAESDSLSSNTEKDMEYTEKYASIPRQISKEKKSPLPSPRTSKNSINEQQREELIQDNNKKEQVEITQSIDLSEESDIEDDNDEEEEEETPIIIKGSYSEKEKEKWRNPVAIPNNPYSKENLDKRLNQSTNDHHLFGRDYYIREAKRAAGGRNPSNEDAKQEEDITTEFQNADNIYVAIPALIQEEDEQQDEITDLESVPSSSRPVSLALSTDSEDVKVYNLETGKIMTYKSKDYTKEIIEASKSPEGIKAEICSNELISSNLAPNKFDENQNHSTEANREPIMNISKLNHLINLSSDIKPQQPTPITSPISKKEFLMTQLSYQEPEIEIEEKINESIMQNPELRDVSKKYLQSLVRNNSRNKNIFEVNTPPVSIQEFPQENVKNIEITSSSLPSIEIEENNMIVDNLIEIETEDVPDYPKSCIDLRFIPMNNNGNMQLSIDNSLRNGFANSTPNLNNEHLYYSEDEENVHEKKTTDLEELETLDKPSVRDLKKLFDQDKPNKATISRSTSNLTTKPEFNAHRQIHSLTARSLSKEYRRDLLPKLQKTETDAIIEKQDNQQTTPTKTDEEEELQHIPPCRSKIEFFEKLKK